MTNDTDPLVGTWYHYPQKAEKFRVVAVDTEAETVEIQYFDGNIDEFSLENWYGLDVEPIEAPEDWTGPMDNVEQDDLNLVGTEMQREDWEAPYQEEDEKRRAGPRIPEDEEQESGEDWGEGRPEEEPWEGRE